MTVTLDPKTVLSGTLDIISSKSDIHRCIICAALSEKPTKIKFMGLSKDIITTVECVKMLGAKAEFLDGCITVTPCDKEKIMQGLTLDCSESGSTARFLLPVAAAICKNVTLVGSGRLPERPFSPLCESLEKNGAKFSSDKLPITVSANVAHGGVFEIPGNISSQYISGLLLMLPLFEEGGEVRITTPLESAGYVDMTVDTMTKFGIEIEKGENSYRVLPNQSYKSPEFIRAQGDWSSAAFWLCADALGANVVLSGLDEGCPQGDRKVIEILENFGAKKIITEDGILIEAGRLHGIEIDASNIPDLVPVLSVVACAARGKTKIYGAKRLRLKESDRLETTRDFLTRLGADVAVTDDGLEICGKGKLEGGTVFGHNDHRIVMSSAICSLICKNQVIIEGAQAVEKSYTTFFSDFDKLNMRS
ncbi:MAG: 3-phosphoshikimate 1-carboxyvinyltransferase [Clostridia bacterium]|nr:3-phosphoshikimate 1-carboxyvinyltransferase [Clostridia bacterium]